MPELDQDQSAHRLFLDNGFHANRPSLLRMNWLQKVTPIRRAAAGLEWALWRKLPLIFALGTALPLAGLGLLHLMMDINTPADERWLQMANYVVIGIVVFHWTAVLTVGIGCVVVMIMKGPAYTADSYTVSHSDKPRLVSEEDEES